MENKNYDKKIYDSAVYDSFRSHQTKYQELLLKKEEQKDKFTGQDAKDLEYHKKRMDYIKKFAKGKQVPLVYVPDSCFAHECKPDTYSTIYSLYMKKKGTYDPDLDLNELLYPAWCYDQKTGEMLVENQQCFSPNLQDKASPYKPNNSFLVKQKDMNTCYFMSLIIGIVSHGGEYIKNKMIRDYPENGADDNNGNSEGYDKDVDDNIDDMDDDDLDNLDVKGRSDKAVVRLFDEDGLPVDVVVDKTRPDKDTRAMWIIVLEKAACVMMSQNKFKNCYRNELSDYTKQIAQGIDWYDLGKGESHEIDKAKINSEFYMKDINYASEVQGIKLVLGKSYEQQWIKNKSTDKKQYIDYIKKYVDSGKLVIVATGNSTGKLKNADHIFYVSFVDMDKKEITTIDSMSGEITTSFDEFFSHIVQIHVTDFPDTEKTIEQEIDLNKIQEIENEITKNTEDTINNTNKKMDNIDIEDKPKDNNSEVINIKNGKDKDKDKDKDEIKDSENIEKTIGQEINLDKDENKNKKDVHIENNKNKNKGEKIKTKINDKNIKEDFMPAVDDENNLKHQTEISKQQDHGSIENKTNENGGKSIEQQNQTDTDNDMKNENGNYLDLISKNQFAQIKKGSIKSMNDLFTANVGSNQIQELILSNPESFSDGDFANFDLNKDDNKTKLGLTSNTPQSGRKRRIFLAVLLYMCFGLGYFTGWSKKLLDAADSIDQHNKYLVKPNNLIKTKSKNDPSLPNEKQVIDKGKSKIGQEHKTEHQKQPTINDPLHPLHMAQKNTQTVAISTTNNIEDKNQERNDLC